MSMTEFKITPDEEDREMDELEKMKHSFIDMIELDRRMKEVRKAVNTGFDLTMGALYKARAYIADEPDILLNKDVLDAVTGLFDKMKDFERMVAEEGAAIRRKKKDKEEEDDEE